MNTDKIKQAIALLTAAVADKPEPPAQDFPPPGFACEIGDNGTLWYASVDQTFVSYKINVGKSGQHYAHWQPANFPGWDAIHGSVKGLIYHKDGSVWKSSHPDDHVDKPDVFFVYRRPEGCDE
jgi:hypothetical protein